MISKKRLKRQKVSTLKSHITEIRTKDHLINTVEQEEERKSQSKGPEEKELGEQIQKHSQKKVKETLKLMKRDLEDMKTDTSKML